MFCCCCVKELLDVTLVSTSVCKKIRFLPMPLAGAWDNRWTFSPPLSLSLLSAFQLCSYPAE